MLGIWVLVSGYRQTTLKTSSSTVSLHFCLFVTVFSPCGFDFKGWIATPCSTTSSSWTVLATFVESAHNPCARKWPKQVFNQAARKDTHSKMDNRPCGRSRTPAVCGRSCPPAVQVKEGKPFPSSANLQARFGTRATPQFGFASQGNDTEQPA